jgi:very-short-patch-repair endonuclease
MVKADTEQKRSALSENRKRARAMRHASVLTEELFWSIARNRQLGGVKFKRQVPIGPYIADFLCAERRLIIELDGPFHNVVRDKKRDDYLAMQGYFTLRFSNKETTGDLATVRAIILNTLHAAPPPHPSPLPRRGRGNNMVRE